MHYSKLISTTVLNIFIMSAIVSAEFYTSRVSLKAMIGADRDIPIMINDYVKEGLDKLNYLKKFAQELQEHNNKAIRDNEEAIRHPVNAFLLIKKIITDWNKAVKIMRSNSADNVIRIMTHQRTIKRINYPAKEGLSGAAIGLLRLQDTYKMNTKDIADGKILNSEMRTVALTAGDCFEIGRVAYNTFDYYHTVMWMQEARERIEKEAIPTANLEDILDYLTFSLYKQGNLKQALLLTDELYRMSKNNSESIPMGLLSINSEINFTCIRNFLLWDHSRAKRNIKRYEDLLEKNGVQRTDMRRNIPLINNVRHKNNHDEGMMLMYEALCRQEVPIDTMAQVRLYCYYKMDLPYLRLAPFKVEIVRQNPLAVLFYEIISDEEGQIIQMLAIPKACLLNGSRIYNNSTGNFESPSFRILKSTRLRPTEHEVVKRIDRRLELATNLEVKTAENLMTFQFLNYGIAGYYGHHLDCALINERDQRFEKKVRETRNRVATFLIYITEPQIGSWTTFMLNFKISVPCIKNAALFWYNLMRNGEVDMRSQHAACPVLTGIKWTAIKWFRERGQEGRRPCGLNQFDQERYVGDLGAAKPKHHLNIKKEAKKMNRKH
uniref:procollagen-proline 4-dioxygenase n=1 Tax=Onchocerca volvulus TaxID=6282 RepID=A0A2K6VMM0_ONCVO